MVNILLQVKTVSYIYQYKAPISIFFFVYNNSFSYIFKTYSNGIVAFLTALFCTVVNPV